MRKRKYKKIYSASLEGVKGNVVEVELCLLPGLPHFEIAGNCDATLRDARERVRAAINNSFYEFPKGKVLASFAPANQAQRGSSYDLPLALALLAASGQISRPKNSAKIAAIGELSLDGRVLEVYGILNRLLALEKQGIYEVIGPAIDLDLSRFLSNLSYYPVSNLFEAIEFYSGIKRKNKIVSEEKKSIKEKDSNKDNNKDISIIDCIIGQEAAMQAISIAAAAWHPLLFLGAPGCGKTSLARALVELMPLLNAEETLEVLLIEQVSQSASTRNHIRERPFRSPHHTVTASALVGGGVPPKMGECSLAHCGVLFLDEITEIESKALDALREPIEAKEVNLARSGYQVTYPANFLLIAAANPCRCGERLEANGNCRCSDSSVKSHLSRISGPLYDRFDLVCRLNRVKAATLKASIDITKSKTQSQDMKDRVCAAWQRQAHRCKKHDLPFLFNSQIPSENLVPMFHISEDCLSFISDLAEDMHYSFRAFHNILRVARTIADLNAREEVKKEDLALALDFRLPITALFNEKVGV